MVDEKLFRQACGCFATGVTVVTGRLDDGAPIGVTVNSFSSVSLDPPLVLFSLDKNALSFDAFSMTKYFAFNILNEDQKHFSNNFATQSPDKFKDIDYYKSENGVPLLKDGLGVIECQMHAVHEGGDHQIIVGEVINITCTSGGKNPLLYYKGAYAALK